MSKIHQITHQSSLAATKVNFFADYFEHLTDVIGKDNHLDIENHLSLMEKLLWQLETNFHKCVPYVSNYLSHPYLRCDDPFLKLFKRHNALFQMFDQYRLQASGRRLKWLSENPEFIKRIKSFIKALKKRMASKALFEIISFLRCKHELSEHQEEIMYCTKILVSEFLLNGHSKKDVNKVFEKIMSRDVWEFPFPKGVISDEQKIKFLSTRTFDQQFQGIFNLLRSEPRTQYFLYRAFGIKVLDTFCFRYHNVTFYSPNHPILNGISENHISLKDGESRDKALESAIIAIVKTEYFSIDLAEALVKKTILEGLQFINGSLKTSILLEPNSYLGSLDLKIFHGMWRAPGEPTTIDDFDITSLNNNPYYFLRNVAGGAKRHFLKHEHLFVKAMESKSVEHFWQYLEALIPTNNNGEKRIREVVSMVTLLIAEKESSRRIANKISWAVQPFSARSSVFGLTDQQQMRYYDDMQKHKIVNFKRLRKEVKHPFIAHLLNLKDERWGGVRFNETRQYYERVLLEGYSQRNALIHTGEAYNKSLVGVNESMSWLVNQFRQALFHALSKNPGKTFEEVLNIEVGRATKLLV